MNGGLNTYGYVGGNPLGFTDPLGLIKCKCKGPAGGGARPIGSKEKICTYKCYCDCSKTPITIKWSAGTSDNAICIGQDMTHPTQPGRMPTQRPFSFDSESWVDKLSPVGPTNDFMDSVEKLCPNCKK